MNENKAVMGDRKGAISPGRRAEYLAWLAAQLQPYGLRPRVVCPGNGAVLRLVTSRSGRVRFVACVAAPQAETWAWVWSGGWVLVTDPRAISMIVRAMST